MRSYKVSSGEVASMFKVDVAGNREQEKHQISNRKLSNLSAISEPDEVKRRSYESPGVEDFLRLPQSRYQLLHRRQQHIF